MRSHSKAASARKAFSYDYYKSGAAAPRLSVSSTPPNSAALLAFDSTDTKTCDVAVSVEHANSFQDLGTCAVWKDLSRGRPSVLVTVAKCTPRWRRSL